MEQCDKGTIKQQIIHYKMENQNIAKDPKKKKMNDFVLTFLGIGALIAALVLLKYLLGALHLV